MNPAGRVVTNSRPRRLNGLAVSPAKPMKRSGQEQPQLYQRSAITSLDPAPSIANPNILNSHFILLKQYSTVTPLTTISLSYISNFHSPLQPLWRLSPQQKKPLSLWTPN